MWSAMTLSFCLLPKWPGGDATVVTNGWRGSGKRGAGSQGMGWATEREGGRRLGGESLERVLARQGFD
jgi:hypothetical protein